MHSASLLLEVLVVLSNLSVTKGKKSACFNQVILLVLQQTETNVLLTMQDMLSFRDISFWQWISIKKQCCFIRC